MGGKKPSVIFIVPYPFGRVASQRFRFEQYWDKLSEVYQIEFQSFLSEESFGILYERGRLLRKAFAVLIGFCRRLLLLTRVYKYDFIFIHREASPIGPPIFEWMIRYVFRKKCVYDFDDAIWLPNTSSENRLVSIFKCHWKVKWICKWAWKVTCGNDFLREFAADYNTNAIYLPTTLDLDKQVLSSKAKGKDALVIGWTGTHSTLKYLQLLLPVLEELQKKLHFEFVVIADKDPQLPLANYRFIRWAKSSEWEDLAQIDIGLMPLENTIWEEGKCGFKALQYMSLGIPALASPTGANNRIIDDGIDGFICNNETNWKQCIQELVANQELYTRVSEKGREKIEKGYSKKAWQETYQALFNLHS